MRVLALFVVLVVVPFAQAAPEQIHLGLPTSDPSTTTSILWVDLQAEADATVVIDTPGGPLHVAAREVGGPGFGHPDEATGPDPTPGPADP